MKTSLRVSYYSVCLESNIENFIVGNRYEIKSLNIDDYVANIADSYNNSLMFKYTVNNKLIYEDGNVKIVLSGDISKFKRV